MHKYSTEANNDESHSITHNSTSCEPRDSNDATALTMQPQYIDRNPHDAKDSLGLGVGVAQRLGADVKSGVTIWRAEYDINSTRHVSATSCNHYRRLTSKQSVPLIE